MVNIKYFSRPQPYVDVSDNVQEKVVRSNCMRIFPQMLAAVSGTLFALSDGMSYGWTAPYTSYLLSNESHIKTTTEEVEWLETALMFGALSGLPFTIILISSIGRKKSLLLATSVTSLVWLIIALGNKIEYLFIARFLNGLCDNMAFVAAPMYIGEIAEQKLRGLLSAIIYIMVHLGCVVVYSVGPFLPYSVTPVIAGTITLLELLVFSFVPESPYFLLIKNKPEEAKKSLEYFRPGSNVGKELADISISAEKLKRNKWRVLDLILIKSNRRGLLIMTVLNSGQHLCGYTVILMNLHTILSNSGSIYMDTPIAAILFAVLMLFAVTLGAFQIDKYGRKFLLIGSSIMTGICLLTLAMYFHLKSLHVDVLFVSWIPIVSVMIYALFFKAGVGLVPIVITAEIFPTNMKPIGMALADSMFLIGGIISVQLYQVLSKFYGLHAPFYVFGCWSFFLTIFTIYFIPETKGKSLEEIQNMLSYAKLDDENIEMEVEERGADH